MDKSQIDYSLYLCTDREIMSCKTIGESVEKALLGGCTAVQLREKKCSSREFLQLAANVKKITEHFKVPLIINDRVDIALLSGADGVHLGQSDLPCKEVRKLAGKDFVIGVSAATVEEAVKAEKDGADYLGVGAVFPTTTKTNTRKVTVERVKEIRNSIKIPFVIIGGVNAENILQFKGTGINGAAVISAILAQKDITLAAENMKKAVKNTLVI